MRLVVINLARAEARRQRVHKAFDFPGLPIEFHEAVDGRQLQPDHYALVDRETRRRLGLWPQTDGSIANWLSQRQVMQQVVDHGPEMVAIFEDDAGLSPQLPEVLAALERKPFDFDIVMLNRRSHRKAFIPCERLTGNHMAGRVRYSDYGSEGYVITREAARNFLESTPLMMWEIDQALSRFWENGLNVFYVDPPVVFHTRRTTRRSRETATAPDNGRERLMEPPMCSGDEPLPRCSAASRRRAAFRLLLDGRIGVTRW